MASRSKGRAGRQARGRDLPAAREVDVAGDHQPHDVGHRPAGREDAEARGCGSVVGGRPAGCPPVVDGRPAGCPPVVDGRPAGCPPAFGPRRRLLIGVPDEVAEPADHLLLDERADRAARPDVDALVRPLGQNLAGDRHRQRRRREVGERSRVVGVEQIGRQALAELVEDLRRRSRALRGRGGAAARRGEVPLAQLGVGDRGHAAAHALAVEVVEGRPPRLLAQALQGGAGRVASSPNAISSGSGCQRAAARGSRSSGIAGKGSVPGWPTGRDTRARRKAYRGATDPAPRAGTARTPVTDDTPNPTTPEPQAALSPLSRSCPGPPGDLRGRPRPQARVPGRGA